MTDLEEKIRAAHSTAGGSDDDGDDDSSDGNASDNESTPGPSGMAYYDEVKPDLQHAVKMESSYEQEAGGEELDIEDDYDPEAQLLLDFGRAKHDIGGVAAVGPGMEVNFEDARSSFVEDSGLGSSEGMSQPSHPDSQPSTETDMWGGISF